MPLVGCVMGFLKELNIPCEIKNVTDPSLGFELFKRIGQEMVKRLQSARRRLLEAEARFSPVGAQHAVNSGA